MAAILKNSCTNAVVPQNFRQTSIL